MGDENNSMIREEVEEEEKNPVKTRYNLEGTWRTTWRTGKSMDTNVRSTTLACRLFQPITRRIRRNRNGPSIGSSRPSIPLEMYINIKRKACVLWIPRSWLEMESLNRAPRRLPVFFSLPVPSFCCCSYRGCKCKPVGCCWLFFYCGFFVSNAEIGSIIWSNRIKKIVNYWCVYLSIPRFPFQIEQNLDDLRKRMKVAVVILKWSMSFTVLVCTTAFYWILFRLIEYQSV